MSVVYGKFEIPSSITYREGAVSNTFARFVAEPFERGFGHTIGNSMRRILLSALESPAIIGFSIEGVLHEFTSIEGVLEDMTNIILNVKGGLLRKSAEQKEHLSHTPRKLATIVEVTQDDLDTNGGQVAITLKDVIKDSLYEIVNPNHVLFTVTAPFKRQVGVRVAVGRGFVASERLKVEDRDLHEILVDAAFSPVRLVNYFVEHTRVGQDTDYDRLILEVTTDGRVSPQEALNFSSQILRKHLDVFNKVEAEKLLFEEPETEPDQDIDEILDKLSLRIDEVELSVRSMNCLAGANIDTLGELVTIPEKTMLGFRNFGKKSLTEIKAKLSDLGLSLGMDLSNYGITADNVKSKIENFLEEKKKQQSFAAAEEV